MNRQHIFSKRQRKRLNICAYYFAVESVDTGVLRVVEAVKVVHLLGDAGVNVLPSAIEAGFQQFE